MDDDEDDFEQEMTEIGNRNRALWKQIGRSVASNVSVSGRCGSELFSS